MGKNKFIVISDIHYPFEDKKAIKAMLQFIKLHKVQTIILNGDILDMYDVSSFDKSPERINSLQKELNKAKALFKELRRILPEAEIVFVKGNHEFRLERYLMKHPELFSLDCLKLPKLLGLDEFDIKYYDKHYKLGPLKITHGSVVRKFSAYTAHAEMDKHDTSGISGHTHRLGVFYKQTPSRYMAWYESGCLCDIEPEYVNSPDWQQGFIYGYVDKESFAVTPIPIVDGKVKHPLEEE